MSENIELPDPSESPNEGSAPSPRNQRAENLAFAAHEVRNPLATALWSAELLVRMPAAERGGSRGAKLVAMCLRALVRLRLLVEDHFLIERLEVGGLPMRLEALALGEVLAAATARRPSDAGPCEAVQVEDDAMVLADRSLLERSLDSVIHAAGRGGVAVRISARRVGDGVVLHVRGAPPPESALADPGRGSLSEAKGYSLSLPMARRVAAALGGELRIADGGYRLMLPAAPPGEIPASEP